MLRGPGRGVRGGREATSRSTSWSWGSRALSRLPSVASWINGDITLDAGARHRLRCTCSGCSRPCEHVGAALSLILEEKLTLGLAQAPPDPRPVEGLSEEALIEQALAERAERARVEKMRV